MPGWKREYGNARVEPHAHTTASPEGRGIRTDGTPPAFDVIPTTAALGAEIRGIDLSAPVPDAIKQALREAWADHLVLVFRGQHIDDDHLLAAASIFGPPHEAASRKYHLSAGKRVDNQYMISKHPSISIVSNLGPDG